MAVDNAIQAPSVPSIAVLQEPEEDSSEISIRIRTLEVALTPPIHDLPVHSITFDPALLFRTRSEMLKPKSTNSERYNAYRGLTLMTEQALPQPARCPRLSQ